MLSGLFSRFRKDTPAPAWTPELAKAFSALKQKSLIETEIINLDTSSESGRARRDELQSAMAEVCNTMHSLSNECGKILGLLSVADDESIAEKILEATERDLKRKLGA